MPQQEFIFKLANLGRESERIIILILTRHYCLFLENVYIKITLLQYDQMVPSLTKYHPNNKQEREKKNTIRKGMCSIFLLLNFFKH